MWYVVDAAVVTTTPHVEEGGEIQLELSSPCIREINDVHGHRIGHYKFSIVMDGGFSSSSSQTVSRNSPGSPIILLHFSYLIHWTTVPSF